MLWRGTSGCAVCADKMAAVACEGLARDRLPSARGCPATACRVTALLWRVRPCALIGRVFRGGFVLREGGAQSGVRGQEGRVFFYGCGRSVWGDGGELGRARDAGKTADHAGAVEGRAADESDRKGDGRTGKCSPRREEKKEEGKGKGNGKGNGKRRRDKDQDQYKDKDQDQDKERDIDKEKEKEGLFRCRCGAHPSCAFCARGSWSIKTTDAARELGLAK